MTWDIFSGPQEQGYDMDALLLYQDCMCTMLLKNEGEGKQFNVNQAYQGEAFS